MSIRITCIKKSPGDHDNPHEAIRMLGWIDEKTKETGTSTRRQIYHWLNEGGYAYIKDNLGNEARLVAAISRSGTEYVKTERDDVKTNNLLSLRECP